MIVNITGSSEYLATASIAFTLCIVSPSLPTFQRPRSHYYHNLLIINPLWSSDAIWWQRSGSTLAQVMACCLTAPSDYLAQCWLIISEPSGHQLRAISEEMPQPSIAKGSLKITYITFHANLPGANELTVQVLVTKLTTMSVDIVPYTASHWLQTSKFS